MPADPVQTSRAPLFDREHSRDAESGQGRRRRPAPDWGGDDLFDHVPRRRFGHGGGAEDRRRSGPAFAHRRAAAPTTGGPPPVAPGVQTVAPGVQAASDVQTLAPGVQQLIAARRAEYEIAAPPAGRRSVTVTGHPGASNVPRTAGPARSRGPRTVAERIGARPERLAAWAVALGMLSSVVALLT